MATTIEQSFRLNLRIMQALWLYPRSHYTRLYRVQVFTRYFLLTTPVPVLGILYFLIEENIDADRQRNDVFIITELVFYFFKLLAFVVNGEEIKKAIYYLESAMFKGCNDKQTDIVANWVRVCQRNCRFYLISIMLGFTAWTLRPLFGKNYELPVDLWLPFDEVANPSIFYVVYFFTFIEMLYPVLCTAITDPLIGGLACLAIGQLEVLKDNLQHLNEYTEEEIHNGKSNKEDLKSKILYEKIGKCVDHHRAILDFIEVYEKSVSLVVFTLFMGVIVRICICCLQLRLYEPFSINYLQTLFYMGMMLVPIYFYCYYGTALSEESSTLINTIYSCDWYDYDARSKKALIILMERCKVPIVVTAGKLLDLSLVTFTMILRRTYSLMAVLNNY